MIHNLWGTEEHDMQQWLTPQLGDKRPKYSDIDFNILAMGYTKGLVVWPNTVHTETFVCWENQTVVSNENSLRATAELAHETAEKALQGAEEAEKQVTLLHAENKKL